MLLLLLLLLVLLLLLLLLLLLSLCCSASVRGWSLNRPLSSAGRLLWYCSCDNAAFNALRR
jgi:hypothetical protein